jgi:hypothetical protein
VADSDTKSEEDSSEDSEDSLKDKQKVKEEQEDSKPGVRLPVIKKKYPHLSIGT